jgi:outer membrane receptor protein involved in Fe transport
MRLPTQILLLGVILSNSARANEPTPGAAPATPAPDATAAAAAAPALNVEPVQLEPVRVTADLWQTPLDEIAASVSVYEGAALAEAGVRHFGDLANQIPNLTYTGGSSRPRYFQIRGIGENSQFEGESPDATVRFLIDDLDFTGIGTVGGTFDTRQVEVLRGPQAGAFGANAAGGVVRIVTNDPTPYATGSVEGTVGTDGLREAAVAVGGPVLAGAPEKLMFRVAVHGHESDGFRRNAFLDADTNARDERSARLKLTWNPGAFWRWDATVFLADADNGYDEFALDNNGRFTFSDEPGRDRQESLAGSLRGMYSGWQDVRFTTVSSATGTDSLYSYDEDWTFDYTPVGAYRGFSRLERDRATWSQELRFDSAPEAAPLGLIDRWTLGLFVSELAEDSDYRSTSSSTPLVLTDYDARTLALFGQAGHDLTDRDRVILGLRTERVDQASEVALVRGAAPVLSPEFDDTLFGGKLTYEHDLTARHTLFASAARGYKAGGVSVDRKIVPGVDPETFETETLWNYEAGLRGRWFDDRLLGGLTAFYLDRSDAQVRGSVGTGGDFRYFTVNADDASTYGLETYASYRLADHWTLRGDLALLSSEIDAYTPAGGAASPGRELANAPAYGYSLGLHYRPAQGWFGHAEWVARDSYLESDDPANTQERSACGLVNTSVGYAWRAWTLTLWARNLLDEEYEKRVFFFGNQAPAYAATRYESRADPRQVGVSAKYEF